MKKINIISLSISAIIPFIWLGIVSAISFIETPLKFQAPGVTIEIGVGIGHIIFTVLNKIEWGLFTLWLLSIVFSRCIQTAFPLLLIIISILAIQTFWLLPALDQRVALLQAGIPIANSPLHSYFIIAEIIKALSLLIAGILRTKNIVSITTIQFHQTKTY